MNIRLATIAKLNYSYAGLDGPGKVSARAKRLAEAIAHGFGFTEYPSSDEYLKFQAEDGEIYIFGQLNRGVGFAGFTEG